MTRLSTASVGASEVFARLRTEILCGRLAPGTRLKFGTLTAELGCSVASLREALIALAAEDLLDSERNRGFRVKPISAEALQDLTQVRVDLESLALRRAIERGSAQWELDILRAQHDLEAVPIADETTGQISAAWMECHEQLHATLVSGCGSPRLTSITATIRTSLEVYWRALEPLCRGTTEQLNAEHRAIVLPALARQTDAAVSALQANVLTTLEPMLKILHERSETADSTGSPLDITPAV